jgi:hypothetical protein
MVVVVVVLHMVAAVVVLHMVVVVVLHMVAVVVLHMVVDRLMVAAHLTVADHHMVIIIMAHLMLNQLVRLLASNQQATITTTIQKNLISPNVDHVRFIKQIKIIYDFFS